MGSHLSVVFIHYILVVSPLQLIYELQHNVNLFVLLSNALYFYVLVICFLKTPSALGTELKQYALR